MYSGYLFSFLTIVPILAEAVPEDQIFTQFLLDFARESKAKSVNVYGREETFAPAAALSRRISREIPSQLNSRLPEEVTNYFKLPQLVFFFAGHCPNKEAEFVENNSHDIVVFAEDCKASLDLRNLSFPGGLDSNVFTYKCRTVNDGSTSIHLSETYQIKPPLEMVSQPFLEWNSDHKISYLTDISIKLERRKDLRGIEMIFSAEPYDPMTSMYENGTFYGWSMDIVHNMQAEMNFTYDIVRSPDGNWGAREADGTWNGFVGQLVKKDADVAISGLTVTDARRKAVDFSVPIVWTDQSIFIKNPNDNTNFLTYFTPLKGGNWAVICSLVVIGGISLAACVRWSLSEDKNGNEFTLEKSFVFSFGALTFGRRWSVTPVAMASRVVFFSVLLCGCLVNFHWKAALVSAMTVEFIKYPFTNLEEMLETTFRLEFYRGGFSNDWFMHAKDNIYAKVWKNNVDLENAPKVYTRGYTPEYLHVVTKQEDYALIDDTLAIIFYPEFRKCEVIRLPTTYLFMPIAFAFPKNSPLLAMFDYQIGKMKEKGVYNRLERRYMVDHPDCKPKPGRPLGFHNMATVFVIYIGGFGAAWICLVLEGFYKATFGRRRCGKKAGCSST